MEWTFQTFGPAGLVLVAGLIVLWFVVRRVVEHAVSAELELRKGEVQEDIERLKADLQTGVETAKADLQSGLEKTKAGLQSELEERRLAFQQELEDQRTAAAQSIEDKRAAFHRALEHEKAGLERTSDLLKHDLQRQTIRAELHANQLNVIYPGLSRRLHKAVAGIGGLYGAQPARPNYEAMQAPELTEALSKMGVSEPEVNSIALGVAMGREGARQDLKRVLRRVSINKAQALRVKVHNFLLLKRIHISKAVFETAWVINENMISVAVNAGTMNESGPHSGIDGMATFRLAEALTEQMSMFDDLLRGELSPPPVAGRDSDKP